MYMDKVKNFCDHGLWKTVRLHGRKLQNATNCIFNQYSFFSGIRDTSTTLRINKIELLQPVDETSDRLGFEKPNNKYGF